LSLRGAQRRSTPSASLTSLGVRDFHRSAADDFFLHEAMEEAVRDGTWTGETNLIARDGREIPVSQVIIAHKNPDGTTGYLSTILRRHEAAVRESNERFQRVANSTNGTIWDLNLATHELWWSDTFATLHGHPEATRSSTLAA
jgi:PAS domain-containing protein